MDAVFLATLEDGDVMTHEQLRQRLAYPLDIKVLLTKYRIRQWAAYHCRRVYVSVSGKDSRILLHLVRQDYPETPGVFCDTGLEFPEIRAFWRTQENIVIVRPHLNFRQVLERYGYPVVSKEVSQKVAEIRGTQSSKLRLKRLHGDKKGVANY